jgi:EcsC protein family
MSVSAKTAAMSDISRLTQALVRGKSWAALEESVLARLSRQFAAKFGARLTKQGLGKAVPALGILIGGTLNWTTLESIVDAADVAYRRRFLLEKYPQLGDDEAPGFSQDVDPAAADGADETISVLRELKEAGGPNLDD